MQDESMRNKQQQQLQCENYRRSLPARKNIAEREIQTQYGLVQLDIVTELAST